MFDWRNIASFPGYSVSTEGGVRNDDTGRNLKLLVNQRGIVYVGLTSRRVQYQRAVSMLVAEAFLPQPRHASFGSPINLDGNRHNNMADNLLWRPRWFARQYFHQFQTSPLGFHHPIEEIDTREEFKSSWEAATKYGLLDLDIKLTTLAGLPVWPTNQSFRLI